MKDTSELNSIEKINEESENFAKEWWVQFFRNFIAMIAASILFLGFLESSVLEYLSSVIFVLPVFLWAQKWPEESRYRRLVYTLCLLLSLIIYLGFVNVS